MSYKVVIPTAGIGSRLFSLTKNLNKSLAEAYRVLKPGGRFLCLEFSKIQNSNLDFIYKNYSKINSDCSFFLTF